MNVLKGSDNFFYIDIDFVPKLFIENVREAIRPGSFKGAN